MMVTDNEYLLSLSLLKESEDHVEFKSARRNYPYNGGKRIEPKERRHCVLGYIVALANENGGRLVLGMEDNHPHEVCGSDFAQGQCGELESAIYNSLGLRVKAIEEYSNGKRVLILEVPSRPIGKLLKFEGVPLMRVGEDLHEMSDAQMLKILSETEPDFSAKICDGLLLSDLDEEAIARMKIKYAEKQNSPGFRMLPTEQVLKDLELLNEGKLNYAALMLVGKQEVIHRLLPQFNIVVEYRKNRALIPYNARKEFQLPLFIGVDKVWEYLNQPLSNPEMHLRMGTYIYDIQSFNEDSVREAILNAVAHRSMQIQSDVVIKQSPDELVILNPGGFPLGVDMNNILTVSSNPRSKRLVEVLQKTGLVERSGQGVDKMFSNSIMDGKILPSFEGTDFYQVQLTMNAKLHYPRLARLVRSEQERRGEDNPLTVFDLIALYHVNRGETNKLQRYDLERLEKEGLVIKKEDVWEIKGGNDPLNDPLNDKVQEPEIHLNKRQNKIVDLVHKNFSISREDLSKKLGVSVATVRRDMKTLGYVWKGHSTSGHWEKDDNNKQN